jgi:hypothetical protein
MHAPAVHYLPTTKLGRWSIVLALGFVFLELGLDLGPGSGRLGVLSGIAAGVTGLAAVIRRGERGLVVLAAIFPLAAVAAFVLAELLF